MMDEELQEIRDWLADVGVGADGWYIDAEKVAHLRHLLAEVERLRAENAALRAGSTVEQKRLEAEQQPSLFPELDIRGEGDNE